jgi:asparagine synthase (glutamine-hydrolysing)
MCGIVGIVDFRGREIDAALLRRMAQSLSHRGPDGMASGVTRCGPLTVGLGHTRLKVIDTSDLADQPMAARPRLQGGGNAAADPNTRCWINFNGEVYNYRGLRRELVSLGARFRTQSDTEVLLRAYLEWGEAAFDRFNGMWALALVDERTGRGVLSRDRFGIKPLYYIVRDGRLAFASEMRPLLMLPHVERRVDPRTLEVYLRLSYLPHDLTLIPGVKKLPPGHHLRFGPDGADPPERYYRLPPPGPDIPSDYTECAHALRRRIEQAVIDRTVADVPLGAFLSGGLDSSIVVAHLAENAAGRVQTFSIGFADQPRYDETEYARLVARQFDTEHREFRLTYADVLGALPGLLDHLSEPFGDSSLLPTAILSEQTREHVTVALSGDGGDELFAGYWRYLGHHYLRRYLAYPGWLRKGLLEPTVNVLPASRSGPWANRVRQMRKMLRAASSKWHDLAVQDPLAAHVIWAHTLSPDLADLLPERGRYATGTRELLDLFRTITRDAAGHLLDPDDHMKEILLADLLVGLPGDMLHKVDLASMRYGLEIRVPMLDPAVAGFAVGLPSSYKLADGRRKRILTDAYRDLLPPEILDRPKMGFELPVGEWLRNQLRPIYQDVVTRETVESLGPLDNAAITRAYDQHCARRADHTELLYSVLVLCFWWRCQR